MDLLLLGDEIFFDKRHEDGDRGKSRTPKRKYSGRKSVTKSKKPKFVAEKRTRTRNSAVGAGNGRPSAMEILRLNTKSERDKTRNRTTATPRVRSARPSALEMLRTKKKPANKIVCQVYHCGGHC